MIYKMRVTPKNLLGLTALFERIHPNHEKKKTIKDQIAMAKAGFGGEENFDKHFLEFTPHYPHAILHDLCLKQDGVFFQMDSVLITPAAIFIFEVKNIAGKLTFMENPDRFVRQLDSGETKPMQSPIAQLERKKYFLQEWLLKRGIQVPIKGVVVLAYTNEIQPVSVPDIHITFAYQVPNYMYSLSVESGPLHAEKIKKLALEMKRNHDEYNPFPMTKKWDISPKDIQTGVQCLSCKTFGMKRHEHKWKCPKCKHSSRDSHIAAVRDWFYLLDNRLTNREFRKFTHIEDHQVAKRLLKSSGLKLKGERRGSYYEM